jgi:hypothetical protein
VGAFLRHLSRIFPASAGAALLLLAAPALSQTAPDLGSTSTFGIVSETFSNTTAGTTVDGDVCFTTGPAVDPTVTGTVQTPCPEQVGIDQKAARDELDAQSCTSLGSAVALDTVSIDGGPPGEFPPGCYSSTGAMSITTGATVTLNGDGVYIFRPDGALDPAAGSSVVTAGGACTNNVFWTPGGGTTIGANAAFVGTVFRGTAAGLSITLGDSASLEGRALAFGSTVTTANNAIAVPDQCQEEPGTLIVEKQTNPEGSTQSFSFTGDAAGDLTDNGQIVVDNLVPGNYSSTESVPDGWELTDIVCNDSDSTGDLGTATANFVLDAGETVTCAFVNTELPPSEGTITILKEASPSDTGQSFDFTGDLGTFSLMHGEFIVETLAPGTYAVSETVPAGWQLDSATCDDGSSVDAIDLEAGESVTCTFSNSQLTGSIIVEKQTNPDGSSQSFSFTGDAAGDLTDGQRIVVGDLSPGNYSSTETVPDGWELTDIVCNDSDSTGDIGAATANFVLAAGETVTCAFINTSLTATDGTITILKQASPSDTGQSFDFSGDLGLFSLAHGGFIVETRAPGTYAVSETVPADWQLDSATCDDGSPVSAIDLEAGESVTCTFTNSLQTAALAIPVFSQGGIALIVLMMVMLGAGFLRQFDPNRIWRQ